MNGWHSEAEDLCDYDSKQDASSALKRDRIYVTPVYGVHLELPGLRSGWPLRTGWVSHCTDVLIDCIAITNTSSNSKYHCHPDFCMSFIQTFAWPSFISLIYLIQSFALTWWICLYALISCWCTSVSVLHILGIIFLCCYPWAFEIILCHHCHFCAVLIALYLRHNFNYCKF